MNIKELMIGDLVKVSHLNKVGKIYRLDCANGDKNSFIALLDGDFSYNDIEPIPLTPKILEKNGFKGEAYAISKLDEHSWIEYYYHEHRLRKYWSGIDEWQNHSEVKDLTFQCHCYYVHEFQHALRLCGIDKTIEL